MYMFVNTSPWKLFVLSSSYVFALAQARMSYARNEHLTLHEIAFWKAFDMVIVYNDGSNCVLEGSIIPTKGHFILLAWKIEYQRRE